MCLMFSYFIAILLESKKKKKKKIKNASIFWTIELSQGLFLVRSW